jgi:uncharacterized protein
MPITMNLSATSLVRNFATPCIGLLLGLLLLAAGSAATQAATVNGLYDGSVRVTDRSEATRKAAFATALGVVLTRVSGRGDAVARVGAAADNAERFVQRYSYLANGLLEVGFDAANVNNLLEKAGLPLWDRDRPATLVVYPQALQGLREAVMATEQTARLRGVPIIWASRETSEQFPASAQAQLQELARRYEAVAVLVARIGPGAPSAASLQWQMFFNGGLQEQAGSAEYGPNLAAEVLGRYYAAAGKDAVRLFMDIAPIASLDAYASTMSYMNGLLMVRSIAVESLQGEVLRLRVELRGNQDSLRRALAIDRKLVEAALAAPDAGATAAQSAIVPALSYRYNN